MTTGRAPINRSFLSNLLLLSVVVSLFFVNYYQKTLSFRPCSIHQWRQCDCLSITKNYFEEGMNFFQPKIHYQGAPGGKAVSELPILNYTVAALWKIFGEHEFIYRLLEYLIFICAVFVVFNTIRRYLGTELGGFLGAMFMLTSPLLVYYGANFIADVPALSIGLISYCLFFNFYVTKRLRFFYLALALGTLAVLMKASALTGLCVIVAFSVVDICNWNGIFRTEKLFTNKIRPAAALIFSCICIAAWYKYALHYNEGDPNNIFLLKTLPLWEMEGSEAIIRLKALFNNQFPLFLNPGMFFIFLAMVIYVFANLPALNTFLKYSFLFCFVYFVIYILSFFMVFKEHDYYLINLFVLPVITVFCFVSLISLNGLLEKSRRFLCVFLIVTFILNGFHAAAIYRLRMIKDDKMTDWFPTISEEDTGLADYLFWDYGNSIKKLEDFRPVLRAHGIKREDLVLSIPDQSFDISLYFMDQKGYTVAREHFMLDTTILERFLNLPIKYIVMSDTTLKLQTAFKRAAPYLKTYFTHEQVEVFTRK